MSLGFAGEHLDTCQTHFAAPGSSESWVAVAYVHLSAFDGTC